MTNGHLPVYDVSECNYCGDIQKAIDDAEAAGGGIVYVPHGSYTPSSTLIIDGGADITLMGDNLQPKGTTIHGSVEIRTGRVGLENLELYGSGSGTGLRIKGAAQENVIRNVRVANFEDGLIMEKGFYAARFLDTAFSGNTRDGIRLGDTGKVEAVEFFGLKIDGNGRFGIAITAAKSITVTDFAASPGNDAEGIFIDPASGEDTVLLKFDQGATDGSGEVNQTGKSGAWIANSSGNGTLRDVTFTNVWFAFNDRHGLDLSAGDGIRFTGCEFVTNGHHGCAVTGGDNITFTGCQFVRNNRDGVSAGGLVIAGGTNILVTGCAAYHNDPAQTTQGTGFYLNNSGSSVSFVGNSANGHSFADYNFATTPTVNVGNM